MSRALTDKSNLESLKKEAKRWLKAWSAGDADAGRRLATLWPKAPPEPGLRHFQHALALDYGFAGWPALREALADRALAKRSRAERVGEILRSAWGGEPAVALRSLQRTPELARDSLHTAVICGDLAEVERRLARDASAAAAKGGPLDWEPLLYLSYGRLSGASESAVAIARLLLDNGANPNAQFDDGWGCPFKVLTGIIGQGEGVRPPHPRAQRAGGVADRVRRRSVRHPGALQHLDHVGRHELAGVSLRPLPGAGHRSALARRGRRPDHRTDAQRARLSARQCRELQSSAARGMAAAAWREPEHRSRLFRQSGARGCPACRPLGDRRFAGAARRDPSRSERSARVPGRPAATGFRQPRRRSPPPSRPCWTMRCRCCSPPGAGWRMWSRR
ncbi:MAG: hypothetical protein WDN69_05670 [Aliidongia sp.]